MFTRNGIAVSGLCSNTKDSIAGRRRGTPRSRMGIYREEENRRGKDRPTKLHDPSHRGSTQLCSTLPWVVGADVHVQIEIVSNTVTDKHGFRNTQLLDGGVNVV
jgi:hypothetical protein